MSYSPGSAGSSRISTSADVSLSNPADKDLLAYNTTLQKWENFSLNSVGALTQTAAAAAYSPIISNRGTWNASSAVSGGQRIVLPNGTVALRKPSTPATTDASFDSAEVGYWTTLVRSGAFNVLDYGAVGDGVNDDTSAIQSAINDAINNNVGVVCLPAGSYNITSGLTISGRIKLLGAGMGNESNTFGSAGKTVDNVTGVSVIIYNASSVNVGDVITINPDSTNHNGTSGLLQDICIDVNRSVSTYNSSTANSRGIYFSASSTHEEARWTLNRVMVKNSCGPLVYIDSGRQAVHLDNCLLYNSRAVTGSLYINTTDTWIRGCNIGNLGSQDSLKSSPNPGTGACIYVTGAAVTTHISGCDLWSALYGIYTSPSTQGVVIANNGIDHMGAAGIYVQASGISIVNNMFHSNNTQKTSGVSDIYVDSSYSQDPLVDGLSMVGNVFYLDGGQGSSSSGIGIPDYNIGFSATGTVNAKSYANTATVGASGVAFTNNGLKLGKPTESHVQSVSTTSYNANDGDFLLCNCSSAGGNITISLPTPSGDAKVTVKKSDSTASTVTIDAGSGVLIDGQRTWVLSSQYSSMTLLCNGTNWYVESKT